MIFFVARTHERTNERTDGRWLCFYTSLSLLPLSESLSRSCYQRLGFTLKPHASNAQRRRVPPEASIDASNASSVGAYADPHLHVPQRQYRSAHPSVPPVGTVASHSSFSINAKSSSLDSPYTTSVRDPPRSTRGPPAHHPPHYFTPSHYNARYPAYRNNYGGWFWYFFLFSS